MIRITRLRLKNFKSFRKADIPFHEGFTCIAGSNASGKSNILDSILFAFGATSLKMLRAARLTDLVNHDASDNYAKVELVLQDGPRSFEISRMVDREGKSVMRLDKKRKTLDEIRSLLLELGVKATGHNIVVQGDITRIIEMSSKQRLGIIEEAAGLAEFEDKKKEALKKLEAVEKRVKEVNIVLKEREQYLLELQKEREAALKYRQLNEELKGAKVTMLSLEMKRIKAELAGAEKQREAMEKEIARRVKEKEALYAEQKELEEKVELLNKKIIESSQQLYSTIGRALEEAKAKRQIVRERAETVEERVKSREQQAQSHRARLDAIASTRPEKEKALVEARKKLVQLERDVTLLNESIATQSQKVAEQSESLQELETSWERLYEDLHALSQRLLDELGKLLDALGKGTVNAAAARKLEKSFAAELEGIRKRKASLALKAGGEAARGKAAEKGVAGDGEGGSFASLMKEFNRVSKEKAAAEERVYRLTGDLEAMAAEGEKLVQEAERLETEALALGKGTEQHAAELEALEKEVAEREAALEAARRETDSMEKERERLQGRVRETQGERRALEEKIAGIERERNEFNLEQSRNEVRIVDLEEEFAGFEDVPLLKDVDVETLRNRVPEIERDIEELGAINMKALEQFGGYEKEVLEVREKATKLEEELRAVMEMIDKIEVKKLQVFMDCFNAINKHFSQLYHEFFKGDGRLGLTNREAPLEGGLSIEAKYKEGVLKSIDAMSGGEKSLTALAFIFALQMYDPSPFYIFDEVDAALDKDNSMKVGGMVQNVARKSQVISISHNDAVIKQADQLIGVALNKQRSSVVGLKLKPAGGAAALPKDEAPGAEPVPAWKGEGEGRGVVGEEDGQGESNGNGALEDLKSV